MKFRWVVLCVVLFFFVTACGAKEPLEPPAEAYHNFFRACEKGDIAEAETYLSEKAIDALEYSRAEAAKLGEGEPHREYFLQYGDPCYRYAHNGANANGIEIESDTPEGIRYWEDGDVEMAWLQWFYEGPIDPMGENPPSENTNYVSTIEVLMIKIDGEWKIDCGFC